eukprot:3436702-Pleurochrysis_carterae.AAC.1
MGRAEMIQSESTQNSWRTRHCCPEAEGALQRQTSRMQCARRQCSEACRGERCASVAPGVGDCASFRCASTAQSSSNMRESTGRLSCAKERKVQQEKKFDRKDSK